jgi:lambda repressor-like predicted transcriptional regulator
MSGMANEHLRAAIRAAGMSVDVVAGKVGVDPKTVDRWITQGRRPHPQTRDAVARLLNVDPLHLWPASNGDARIFANPGVEVIHVYPTRSAVPVDLWLELIRDAEDVVDVLVFSGQFLVEQFNIIPTVRAKAATGVRFRFLVGDENSEEVARRAREEGTEGGLQGRIQMMRRYLSEVSHLDGVEVRTHSTILYNSIYRFDDQAFVNPHAFGTLAGQSPVIHLQRVATSVMWLNYMRSFERTWEAGTPELGNA